MNDILRAVQTLLRQSGYHKFDLALREIAELRPMIDPCAELCASVKEHFQ